MGRPGRQHEDATEPMPPQPPRSGRPPDEPTHTPFSHVSGGGGERDRHHGHDVRAKRDTEENSIQRSKP